MKARNARGMTLIEISLSLLIMSSVILGTINLSSLYATDLKAKATAQGMVTFTEAVKEYLQDNAAAVAAVATATTPALINTATLTAVTTSNPTGGKYINSTILNGYGQRYCALVIEPSASVLNTLVFTEGGTDINDIDLAQVAAAISASGFSGGGIYASDATQVRGTQGTWSLPVSQFAVANNLGKRCDGVTAGVPTITAGHPGAVITVGTDGKDGLLSRSAVAGRPELNEMNTTLDMGGNTLSAAGAYGNLAQGIITAESVDVDLLTQANNHGVGSTATVGSLQLLQTVTPGTSCGTATLARTADGAMATCSGYLGTVWAKNNPQTYRRVTFSHDDSTYTPTLYSWTVPQGVYTVFVTMAGGGGTGQGWRLVSGISTGHSGGVMVKAPMLVTPGAVLTITVGAAGALSNYTPSCDDVLHTGIAGTPALSGDAQGTGEFNGFSGGTSSISGVATCSGGGAGSISTGNTYYATPTAIRTPNGTLGYQSYGASFVAGSVAVLPGAPGVCSGSNGVGVLGLATPYAPGLYSGGISPIGYGSGGGVRATDKLQVWSSPVSTGRCIQALPAQSGVVMIDYPI